MAVFRVQCSFFILLERPCFAGFFVLSLSNRAMYQNSHVYKGSKDENCKSHE